MKKKLVIVIVLLLLFSIAGFLVRYIIKENQSSDGELTEEDFDSSADYAAYVLREKYPTDVIWYGKWDTENQWNISVRCETEVSNEILTKKSHYRYVYIVVNNANGDCGLSDEDYKKIGAYLENNNYHFCYFGKDAERVAKLICETAPDVFEENDNNFYIVHCIGASQPTFGVCSLNNGEIEKERISSIVESAVRTLYDHFMF